MLPPVGCPATAPAPAARFGQPMPKAWRIWWYFGKYRAGVGEPWQFIGLHHSHGAPGIDLTDYQAETHSYPDAGWKHGHEPMDIIIRALYDHGARRYLATEWLVWV